MVDISNTVITKEQIERLRILLDTTDFNGVDYNKEVSLLEQGFVYDSRTGATICTHPSYVWNKKDSPIKFGVTSITSNQITEAFVVGKDQILSDITEFEFNHMCDEYKIYEIETKSSKLGLRSVVMEMTFDELVIYLEDYISKTL
jgi:hypothetical protein